MEFKQKTRPVKLIKIEIKYIILECAEAIYTGVCIYLVARFRTFTEPRKHKISGVEYGTDGRKKAIVSSVL
jgi:hypothetical protein